MLYVKHIWLMLTATLCIYVCYSQVSIPWSATVNVNFGEGTTNPGPALGKGNTSYAYTTQSCPEPGFYTIVNKRSCTQLGDFADAGHIFLGPKVLLEHDSGYVMLVSHMASAEPKVLFIDTAHNLCSNSTYLFWAGIRNVGNSTCIYPNFTLSAETLSGQVIQLFETGNIGGTDDHWAWNPGYHDASMAPSFPFYGSIFTLPAGITDIIVKITANPSSQYYCSFTCAVDNIFLTTIGPDNRITTPGNPDAWVTGGCFNGNPVVLNGSIGTSYHNFGSPGYTDYHIIDPAVQWQQSLDNGFTWMDIPGATNLDFSETFAAPDTFFIRMRCSESENIGNDHCSILSNVIKVQVDGLPQDVSVTSNSPVCTDADLLFELKGGASYLTTGPGGFSDNSAFPHIFNPTYADTGWYYSTITTFGGCAVTDSTHVIVIGPDLKINPDQFVCYGEPAQLQASGGVDYVWSPVTGLSAPDIPNPRATLSATTKYQVKVTDQSGCGAQAYTTVYLKNNLLKAGINAPAIVCPDDLAVFKDSSDGNIVAWQWDFGNGRFSNEPNPQPQRFTGVPNQENFAVKLTVTDTAGCTNTAYSIVKAVSNCHIAVPGAFTPNNDGQNDYLYPLNAYEATNLLFRIYNRNGGLLFETRDWTRKWDGKVNGYPQPGGTYVWTLSYTDSKTNVRIQKNGTTVLLR